MDDTLTALNRAIIDAPADRTVRLVYADALDESGDPLHAARAEFIRAQITIESLPDADPERAAFVARCDDLFSEHWIDWWKPVCAAVGLPEPYVPKQRFRDRVKRFVKNERRLRGAPYTRTTDYPGAYTIRSEEHGFTAQFIGGFPELLYFTGAQPSLLPQWAAALPLARLRWVGSGFPGEVWEAFTGPHMANVSELTFERLPVEAATLLARSEHLRKLVALKVLPLRPTATTVRELVHNPKWTGLRSLALSGVTPPDAIQTLADLCTLTELEELSFGICDVPEPFGVPGLTGAIGVMLSEMFTRFLGSHPMPPGPIHWPDYWPALEALARSSAYSRLRTLRVSDSWSQANPIGGLIARLEMGASGTETLFSDTVVRALADGLNPDRLVRLELPAARLSPASRADLVHRFGSRFVPV